MYIKTDFKWDLELLFFLHSVDEGVVAAAVDSHPRRTNGFMTGCLINDIKDYTMPTVEDLPK